MSGAVARYRGSGAAHAGRSGDGAQQGWLMALQAIHGLNDAAWNGGRWERAWFAHHGAQWRVVFCAGEAAASGARAVSVI
ncbi:hypothetical protein MB84_27605 (plasmid) [Pandoraea oxalativorans]|uniref:Uncharacterized protein n=1 Tax=Pandoraea oxalativorans TaxID=573737 RepID=A0A0G3IBG6_9BURK|nr:hypothetical protein MB84_27605 [Pandoraea oxalativorans]